MLRKVFIELHSWIHCFPFFSYHLLCVDLKKHLCKAKAIWKVESNIGYKNTMQTNISIESVKSCIQYMRIKIPRSSWFSINWVVCCCMTSNHIAIPVGDVICCRKNWPNSILLLLFRFLSPYWYEQICYSFEIILCISKKTLYWDSDWKMIVKEI